MNDNGNEAAASATARFARDAIRNARAQIGDPVQEVAALLFGSIMILEERFGKAGAGAVFATMIEDKLADWRAAQAQNDKSRPMA